mmetsp:Transcript_114601/g.335126  ORF Transcript_114601/g.335126 Transcript_114601/m.335126 type:complete len:341 (+) Transcript_114601:2011-3033(+)
MAWRPSVAPTAPSSLPAASNSSKQHTSSARSRAARHCAAWLTRVPKRRLPRAAAAAAARRPTAASTCSAPRAPRRRVACACSRSSASSAARPGAAQVACRTNCGIQAGSSAASSSRSLQTHSCSGSVHGRRQVRRLPSSPSNRPRATARHGASPSAAVRRLASDIARNTSPSATRAATSVPAAGAAAWAERPGGARAARHPRQSCAGPGPARKPKHSAKEELAWRPLPLLPALGERAERGEGSRLPLGEGPKSIQWVRCSLQKGSLQRVQVLRRQFPPNWASHSGSRQPMTRSSGTSSGACAHSSPMLGSRVRGADLTAGCSMSSQPLTSSSVSGSCFSP